MTSGTSHRQGPEARCFTATGIVGAKFREYQKEKEVTVEIWNHDTSPSLVPLREQRRPEVFWLPARQIMNKTSHVYNALVSILEELHEVEVELNYKIKYSRPTDELSTTVDCG